MRRRRSLFWPALAVWCGLLVLGGIASVVLMPDAPPPRHVVVIVLDALRADHLAVYGSRRTRTPAIDRLARNGVVFERAYAQSSWTGTSMASMLTGTYPGRHALWEEIGDASALHDEATTMAELFRAAGFGAIGVSANPNVSASSGFDQGFNVLPRPVGGFMSEATAEVVSTLDKILPRGDGKGDKGPRLLVFLHFLDPHDPYDPRKSCEARLRELSVSNGNIKEGKVFRVSGEHDLGKSLEKTGELPRPHPLSKDDVEYLRRLYDCEIEEVDRAVGRVLDLLEQRGILEQAMVVLMADHGEEFLDHGQFRHGYHLYEETVRVPLIIRAPGLSPGRWPDPVQLVDILPTALAMTGARVKTPPLDGKVLGPVSGDAPNPARAFGMTRFRKQNLAYLVEDQLKLIVDFKTGRRTLFNLRTDPHEKHGSEGLSTVRGLAMLKRLQELANRSGAKARKRAPMDEQLKQQLRSLGYVE